MFVSYYNSRLMIMHPSIHLLVNYIKTEFINRLKREMERKKYIRFKPIPPSGKSSIYSHGNKIGEEIGVSVFDAVNIDGTYHIVIPMPITKDMLDDIYGLLNYSNEGIYLVEGEQIGIGTDNEPLIKDAIILSEITDIFYKKKQWQERNIILKLISIFILQKNIH